MNALTSLDALAPDVSPASPLTGLALFRDRRERAAALWADVPGEQFDLRNWWRSGECGTVCCALGWLSALGVDGWNGTSAGPRFAGVVGYKGADIYFGLPSGCGGDLFRESGRPYARKHHATGRDVGEALLAAAYSIPEDAS